MRPELARLSSSVSVSRRGPCWLWHDDCLDAQTLWRQMMPGSNTGETARIEVAGRGAAWRLDIEGQSCVCRQYRRGGLMGRVNRQWYVWIGAQRTRSYREFVIMRDAADQGLLVPRPMAALACHNMSLFYRAAILTPWVDHIGSLASVTNEQAWFNAGQSIARLHAAQIWHADLNVHNILIDTQDQAWLIDFDRALGNISKRQMFEGNLRRLKRSVDKVCPDVGRRLWPLLCEGYAKH